jgi:hypothetical protein
MSSKRHLSGLGWRVAIIAAAVLLVCVMLYSFAQLIEALNAGVGLP